MGSLEGKVAFITGAARGQGRNHAVRLAERGVDVIALDLNDSISTVPYAGATDEDLAETIRQVQACGRRIVAPKADTRDLAPGPRGAAHAATATTTDLSNNLREFYRLGHTGM